MGSNSSPSFSKRLSRRLKAPFRNGSPNESHDNSHDRHDRHGSTDPAALKNGIIKILASQSKRIPADIHVLMQLIDMKSSGGYEDDSRYVLEHLIQLVASLPTSDTQKSLTSSFISTLWDNLRHPPLSYLGNNLQFRTADGSNNSIMYPSLGKAGTPYAKSVVATHPKIGAPPDAGTLFDALLARKAYKPHPSKFSSTFFHLATLVIHDIFYTDPMDSNINLTSSYLDLSTLYGFNQDQQNLVRTKADGLLKPDCFYDARLLGFPPAVAGLIIGLNRFHNSVVRDLASINEGGRFSMPNLHAIEAMTRVARPDLTEAQLVAVVKEKFDSAVENRDNDLFQTGRLVTCGLYINVVLGDYLRTIVAMNRTNDSWVLDPRAQGPDVYSHQGAPTGVGNQVSCEFNLIYRWHATLSQVDEKWVGSFMEELFPGKDMGKISVDEFKLGLYKWAKTIDPDPSKRSVGGLKRNANGEFDDAALVAILTASTEDCAAAFDSGIPVALRAVTMLGVEQSRSWNTASLNEFRHFFGLVQHKTFEQVNSDTEMQKNLRHLYDHPDEIELYPGILIENTKIPMTPGSGLCPNQTIGKAILSDAIALVRGDRFFTVDYSPRTLTQFGYNEVASDMNVAQGGLLYRVLMRAFPGWYEYNSVYALFPLTIPSENKKILTDLGKVSLFSFKPPSAPVTPCVLSTARSAQKILAHPLACRLVWDKAICGLTGQSLSAKGRANAGTDDKLLKQVLYDDVPKGLEEIWDFYIRRTTQLVREGSCKFKDYFQVDIIRDVINSVHVQFVAALFAIPLKDNDEGHISEKELYDHLTLLFGYAFLQQDEVDGFTLKATAVGAYKALRHRIKSNFVKISLTGKLKALVDASGKSGSLDSYGINLIRRLMKAGKSVDEIADLVIPSAAAMAASQIQQSIQMLDVYLSEEYKQYWPEIVKLAQSDEKSKSKLRGYAVEGSRLSTKGFGLVRCCVAQDIAIQDGVTTWNIESGDEVFVNLAAVNRDPEAFPEPAKLNPERDCEMDLPFGWGLDSNIGTEISIVASAAILSCLALLPNLRRAPGAQGHIKSFVRNDMTRYLKPDWGNYSFLPASMKVEYQ